MSRVLSPETISAVVAFHGHQCPGLAIGMRVAEYARTVFPDAEGAALVCITETDMCGVDAIQYLTGCTFGKGNLIHRDYGKTAFSFFDRAQGQGVRITLNSGHQDGDSDEMAELMQAQAGGALSAHDQDRLRTLRAARERHIMTASLSDLFNLVHIDGEPPRPARILRGLMCGSCGEKTMESRTRRFAGRTLCIPCFSAVEQKI